MVPDRVIDAHQHFWLLKDRVGEWPPPDLATLYRDFLPSDLMPQIEAAGVSGTVLVQSLPSLADTRFMLGLAAEHQFIRGVVGWADLKAKEAPAIIAELAREPKLKGLRPMLQDIVEDDWIDDPQLDPAVDAMLAHGLVFDALVLPRHLPALETFARRHPDLPIVIDHGAKPVIAEGRYDEWRAAMAKLAGHDNVCCKLSGLLTERGKRPPEAVRPYAEAILDLFGPERVIWGSDWPVLDLAGDYAGWLAQARAIVPETAHSAVFGGNARRIYRLEGE